MFRVALSCALAVSLSVGCSDSDGGFTLGPEAQIDIAPSVIEFGDVPRGDIARRNVTIRHIGVSGTVRLDPIELVTDSPDLSIGLIEKTELLPGEQSRIQIVYNSDHDEPDFGELTIGHNLATSRETIIPVSTPGQRGVLVATPGILDFAVVQAGAPRTLEVTVLNGGTAPATLVDYEVTGDAADFRVDLPAGSVVPVDGSATLYVTYAPEGRDSDTAVLTLLTEREDVSLDITMYGEEETPVLTVEPGLVQLGWTVPSPNQTNAKLVQMFARNDGNTTLEISQISLQDAISTLTLSNLPTGPFTLEPGEAHELGVVFTPVEEIPMTPEPLGVIRFDSNDEARNPLNVQIFGAAGVPSIVVIPEDVVDFAFVAEGFTALREVTLVNEGASPVTVTAARLVEPTSEEFSFVNADILPATLNPNETLELKLHFENRGGATGSEFAKFYINTTDPVVPEYPLDVVARRAQRPTCEPAFVPDLLSLGAHRPTEVATGTMRVVNFGSGSCEYQEFEFDGCLPVPAGVRTRYECNSQIAFNAFEIVKIAPPGTRLDPGETMNIDVSFVAPSVQNTTVGRDSWFARLALIMFDPNSSRFKFVAPPGGFGRGVNLRAETAVPIIEVDPPVIDFGLVRTDCQSQTRQITVFSTGPLDATISGVVLEGCPPDMQLDMPPSPATVPGFGALSIGLNYVPGSVGAEQCVVKIYNDSDNLPVAEVQVFGEGTDADHQVDSFLQVPPSKVDVLFVVDDSFSMGDDQERLRQELPDIVEIATQWGQDYHLAVTTTDTQVVQGRFKGLPRYVTPEDDPAIFAENLVVGTNGHFLEAGLEGAYMGLVLRSERTDIACQNLPNACPADDGFGFPLICLEGQCSGRNWGFMRDDAELVIIIVSDEEDGSIRPVPFYIDQFANLKKANSGVGVVVHSIITTADGCFGFGTPGFRYQQVSEAFGGAVVSICEPDFGAVFEDVGMQTFGLKDRFYPTLPPDPTTLAVRVDGTACSSGWTWNAATNSVVFAEGASCYPQHNQTVELEYDVFCAAPAP